MVTPEAWTFFGILVTALGGMGVAWLARGQDASARKRQADQATDAAAASPLIMQMLQHAMTEQSAQITRQAEQASDQQERIEQLTRLVYQQGEELSELRRERDLFNAQLSDERAERDLERESTDERLTRQGQRIAQLEQAMRESGVTIPPWVRVIPPNG